MNITIELDGISRIETGREEVTLAVALGATGQEVLRALITALPKLAKTTVNPATGEFYDDEYWLAYQNRVGIPDLSLPLQLAEGARLLILTAVC